VTPEGWSEKLLGDFASLSAAPAKQSGGSRYVIVDMGSVAKDGSLLTHKKTDAEDDLLEVGDLVMPKDDIGGGQIIGKAIHIDAPNQYVLGDHVYRLRLSQGHPPYVRYAINSHQVNSSLRSKVVGSAQLGLGRRSVLEQPIPFPPLGEQQAIAEALSDADALVESLDALIAKKRDMKQAAMQQLLTGRTRLPGFTEEWQIRQVGDLCSPRSSRIDPRVSGGGDFCIELEHLESGTARLLGSGLTTATSSLKTKFVADDVLFGKLRSYLRKSWLANRSGVCSTEVWVLAAVPDRASPRFLAQVVQTDGFIDAASMSYGTHMPRSDWSIVAKYELEVPSLPEQEAVGTVLLDMDSEIDALVAQREKAELVKQGMMQELLSGRVRLV